MKKVLCVLLMIVMFVSLGCSKPAASKYPEKPIELVVPYKSGGGTHLAAEVLVPDAQKFLGQPLQINCKGGAGGAVGATYVAKSKADGYTLLYTTLSLDIAPHLNKVEYNIDDFIALAQCSEVQPVIAVKADSPWQNAKELVAWAKENPGELTWTHPGVGSSLHILGANAFFGMGINEIVKDIPYNGTAPGVAAVLGGHVSAISTFLPAIAEQVRAGQLRVIGVSGEDRLPEIPDVPTFNEQGFKSLVTSWRGVFAPKDTPKEILEYLDKNLGKLINDPAFAERAKQLGEPVVYRNMEEFNKLYKAQYQDIGEVVKKLGLNKE